MAKQPKRHANKVTNADTKKVTNKRIKRLFTNHADGSIMSKLDTTGDNLVTTKTKSSNPRLRGRPRSVGMPAGNDWSSIVARGLIRLREKRRLSVKDLIDKYGINKSTYYRVERGQFPETTAIRIDELCDALRVSFLEIVTLGEADHSKKPA